MQLDSGPAGDMIRDWGELDRGQISAISTFYIDQAAQRRQAFLPA